MQHACVLQVKVKITLKGCNEHGAVLLVRCCRMKTAHFPRFQFLSVLSLRVGRDEDRRMCYILSVVDTIAA